MIKLSANTNIKDFTTGSITKQLLRFSLPLLMSNLLQIVYNMVDMIVVGQVLGDVGLSAVSLGGDVTNFMTFIVMGFANAGQILISQYIGEKRTDRIGRLVGTLSMFMLIMSATISVVCLILRVPILKIMNTPPESFDEALAYSSICMAGLVLIAGYNLVSAILRGMGDSKHPFMFISIAAVMNLVLDIVLVVYCRMGAAGAALATVVSQGFSFLCCVFMLFKQRKAFALDVSSKEFFSIDRECLRELVNLGIPMAIRSAAIQFSKLCVHSWVNSYGVAVSAFSGIQGKILNITNLIALALSTAGATMIGQNIAAKEFGRVKRIILNLLIITMSCSMVLCTIFLSGPERIYSIFTSEAAVIAIGMEFVPVCVIMFISAPLRSSMSALINGSGNTKVNFIMGIMDGIVVRLSLSFFLGLAMDMGYMGFWLGDVCAGFTPFLVGVFFYFSGNWKEGRKAPVRS